MKKISLLFIVFIVAWADTTPSKLPAKEPLFYLSGSLGVLNLSRSIKGNDVFVTQIDDIYEASVDLAFPTFYNLSLGYTQNITQPHEPEFVNPKNFDNKVSELIISSIPYYSKKWGGVAITYLKSEQNSRFINTSGSSINAYEYNLNNDTLTLIGTLPSNAIVVKSKDRMESASLAYIIPEYSWAPEGFNISYNKVKRYSIYLGKLHLATTSNMLLVLNGEGALMGVGVTKDRAKLPYGTLCLRKLNISQGALDGVVDTQLSMYDLGLTYKSKHLYFDLDIVLVTVSADRQVLPSGYTVSLPEHQDFITKAIVGFSF